MNKYELSFTAKDCLKIIKNKIKNSKSTIDLEAYYFSNDTVGTEILKLLKEKSKEGVKVRILLDHFGSYRLDKKTIIKDLNNSGIEIRFFNSILPFSKNRKRVLFLRNHRRSIIIDNDWTFTGSVCFSNNMIDWLELGIFIKDKEINEKTKRIFNMTWNKVYYPTFKIGKTSNKDIKNDDKDFTYLTQAPLQFQRNIYNLYIKKISQATQSIYLVAPYFIPDQRLMRNLRKAKNRGVEINIILPIKTNWLIADIARNTYINIFFKLGIKIHFLNKMIHSKFAIFDNDAFIGTMNLDNLSLKYNYESGVYVKNQECVNDLKTYAEFLLSKSFVLNKNSWNERNILLKISEKIIWIFRKIL